VSSLCGRFPRPGSPNLNSICTVCAHIVTICVYVFIDGGTEQ
jgi:hypothetical protein